VRKEQFEEDWKQEEFVDDEDAATQCWQQPDERSGKGGGKARLWLSFWYCRGKGESIVFTDEKDSREKREERDKMGKDGHSRCACVVYLVCSLLSAANFMHHYVPHEG
jgi:hypothetical protein